MTHLTHLTVEIDYSAITLRDVTQRAEHWKQWTIEITSSVFYYCQLFGGLVYLASSA